MTVQDNLVLEGTWKEINRLSADLLVGRRVRVQLLPAEPAEGEFSPVLFHETATPEEWAEAFLAWGRDRTPRTAPPLSDEAISRESIYDEYLDRQR